MSNTSANLTGAEALIKCLESHGVEYIFGYSGGAVIPIFDAIVTTKTKIKLIATRHEQGAVHMADGYARARGKPGVVLITSGLGVGNIISGLMTAQMDSVPMIVISGQQVTSMLGRDALQEADTLNLTMPVVKHNYLILETNDIPDILNQSFAAATSGRPGPVLIDIPKDISSAEFTASFHEPVSYVEPSSNIDKGIVSEIVEQIKTAQRPLILAGHGVIIANSGDKLKRVAEQLNTPVVSTLLGKGASDVKPQTLQAISNMKQRLNEVGLDLDSVVKTTVFLVDMGDYQAMNEAYEAAFAAPRPARSAVAVRELPRLADSPLLVEIEAVASTEAA